jgi:choline-glycine betaine transporter
MDDVQVGLDGQFELLLALVIWYAVPLFVTALVVIVSLIRSHSANRRRTPSTGRRN